MINVLQLAAGQGSRFAEYSRLPKPFIKVDGIPMFFRAYDSMDLDNIRYHILFQESHVKQYNPQQYVPDAHIHTIDHYTDGAATSAMTVIDSSEYKDEPWLVIDCDFILEWNGEWNPDNSGVFVHKIDKWEIKSSYSAINDNNHVIAVAEKQPISSFRNTGHYYWNSGTLFSECYNYYVDNNIRILNECYMAPLYNAAIRMGNTVEAIHVDDYIPIGTPEDLERYYANAFNEPDINEDA